MHTGLKREGGPYLHNIYIKRTKMNKLKKNIYETVKKSKLILTNNLSFIDFLQNFFSRVKYCFRVGKSMGMCIVPAVLAPMITP